MAVALNGGRRIMVREAQIKTASVEIRALTINGRQVTQSVFCQLHKEDLIDEQTRAFRGLPWGRVNYYRPPCKDDHMHLVWQKGDELRRACVHEEGYQQTEDWQEGASSAAVAIGRLRAWQWLHGAMERGYKDCPASCSIDGLVFSYMQVDAYLRYDGPRLVYCLPDWAERALRYSKDYSPETALSNVRDDAAREERWMQERYGSPEGLRESIATDVGYMVSAKAQWAERWAELCALDQLFIAV